MVKRKTIDSYFPPSSSTAGKVPRRVYDVPASNGKSNRQQPSTSSSSSSTPNVIIQNEEQPNYSSSLKDVPIISKVEEKDNDDDDSNKKTCFHIFEKTGDIFASPRHSILLHACNSQGSWGAGIALAFKNLYPRAYSIYHSHCLSTFPKDALPGTALLIPPPSSSSLSLSSSKQAKPKLKPKRKESDREHFIGCLFTSQGKGRSKDSPETILENTEKAVRDLQRQIDEWNCSVGKDEDGEHDGNDANDANDNDNDNDDDDDDDDDERVKTGALFMCKINSGLFNVPWEQTKAVIEMMEIDEVRNKSDAADRVVVITVVERA